MHGLALLNTQASAVLQTVYISKLETSTITKIFYLAYISNEFKTPQLQIR